MKLDVEVAGPITRSTRARQLEGSFDVPPSEGHALRWHVEAPIEDGEWSVGLIVGPSGCGKSTLLRHVWGETPPMEWNGDGVIDDFDADDTIDDIANICGAVGFNTIPAWMRPYHVLSNGERFRVELARRLLDSTADTPIVFDEWTSVVDRQVARIGSHAAQKWVRRHGRQMIAATCHADVEDWLQPDWVIEPLPSHLASATVTPSVFRWRSVRSRPPIEVEITPATYDAWALFAPFHYLTSHLHTAAKCYVLWARTDTSHEWQPAAFAGMLHRPKPKHQSGGAVWGLSRVVTLPDWQGLGLAFVLMDTLASAYAAVGCGFATYPAHPALIHAFDRSPNYKLMGQPEIISTVLGPKSKTGQKWRPGGRPNATFRYVGPPMESRHDAVLLFRCGR